MLDLGSSKNPRNNFILEASEIFRKSRTVVGHFHHSTEADKNLRDIAAGIDESQSMLIQDNNTRWDSTLDMIGSVSSTNVNL